MNKIVKWNKGFSNTNRYPYVTAILDCGHHYKVEFTVSDPWGREHDESIYVALIGDSVKCEKCASFERQLARLESLDRGALSHARFRPHDSRGGSEGAYYVYVLDPKSPSGVHLFLSIDANARSSAALDALRLPALSPTEKR